MDNLRDLYQEVILDHNKNPRNFHKMANATRVLEGQNPLCGDHYTLFLKIEKNMITDISFEGSGCAISKASASLMCAILKGKTIKEAEKLFKLFHEVVTGDIDPIKHLAELGKLAVFSGVSEFPMRVKCATLAWHTMYAALHDEKDSVSTE